MATGLVASSTQVPSTVWHEAHEEAKQRLKAMLVAVAAQDWRAVDEGAQWIFTDLRAHNEAEEREIFPVLTEIGADNLRERLHKEHRQMWELNLMLLSQISDGAVQQPEGVTLLTQRLVDLIREHIELEEQMMLPLLHGKSLYWTESDTEEGYLILEKQCLAPDTWSFVVQAPMVARHRQPGQFCMVAPFPESERIPLTLAGGDPLRGTIRFIMQEVGATTRAIARLSTGDRLFAVAGPMGQPTELVERGTVALVAGGYGSAAILPAAEALHARGQRVVTILGGRTSNRVLLAKELAEVSDLFLITTDDGSWGRMGLVTEVLSEVLAAEPIAQVVAVGPLPMMRAVSDLTRPSGVPTLVSLNALMVDGTGMCGGCRVSVGGETRFACFEGPDFDGHLVDFDMLRMRQGWYKEAEQAACDPENCHVGRRPASGVGVEAELPGGEADLDWRALDLTGLKPSQKMKIPRQDMACLPPETRVCSFEEVSLGLSPEQARLEAARCLQCKQPFCMEGCPVGIDIPGFLSEIAAGRPEAATRIIKESSSLGAICGRVCPQEKQCERRCVVGIKGESVAIGRLERYASDTLLDSCELVNDAAPTGKRVAVVGAGPAGLTVAGELVKKGHEVTVYDALHKAGGVLLYGIPEFRLPNSIVDQEVQTLKHLGVKFVLNTLVGRSITLSELRGRHDAVFIGTGAGLPKMMDIPGEELKGVYTANEFLTRINLMRADRFPEHTTPVTVGKRAVVVGCGNTAMDAARCARRMGAESVTVVYRRTQQEASARVEEMEHADEEGINFRWLKTPVQLMGDEHGWLKAVQCAVMEPTEPGPDGRRGVQMTDTRVLIPCDTLIVALGFDVNPLLSRTEKGLRTLKGGVVVVDEATGETSLPGVYAGGDVITGGATVILAMGQGRRAAGAIHAQFEREAVAG